MSHAIVDPVRHIVSQALLDEIGPNDPFSEVDIARHHEARRELEARWLHSMQHLHILPAIGYEALMKEVNIIQSFEMGYALTLHFGRWGEIPIWLIDNIHGDSYSALFVDLALSTHDCTQQPFELENFYVVDPDVVMQTLKESQIMSSCDLGAEVIFHCGMRGTKPVWIMENTGMDGIPAVWFDDGSPSY